MICIHGATSKKCEFCIRIRDEGCGVNFLVEIYPTASFHLRVECSLPYSHSILALICRGIDFHQEVQYRRLVY